jgi:hypothetical protein
MSILADSTKIATLADLARQARDTYRPLCDRVDRARVNHELALEQANATDAEYRALLAALEAALSRAPGVVIELDPLPLAVDELPYHSGPLVSDDFPKLRALLSEQGRITREAA